MKKLVTLHMYQSTYEFTLGQLQVDEYDMRKSKDLMKERVYLGQTEVEIDYPEIDTRQAQIDQLEAEVQNERAQSQSRVNLLLDRISKLQAIGHDE